MTLPPRSTLGNRKNKFLEPLEPQLPWPQERGPDVKGGALPDSQNVKLS